MKLIFANLMKCTIGVYQLTKFQYRTTSYSTFRVRNEELQRNFPGLLPNFRSWTAGQGFVPGMLYRNQFLPRKKKKKWKLKYWTLKNKQTKKQKNNNNIKKVPRNVKRFNTKLKGEFGYFEIWNSQAYCSWNKLIPKMHVKYESK